MDDNRRSFSASKIAALASLSLSPSESDSLQSQLADVLEFASQIDSVDLNGVEPFFGPTEPLFEPSPKPTEARTDAVSDSHDRNAIMKNAARHDGEFYLVPPVFGDDG